MMSQPKQVGRGREEGWSENRAGAAEVILSNRDVVVLFVFIDEVLMVLEILGLGKHTHKRSNKDLSKIFLQEVAVAVSQVAPTLASKEIQALKGLRVLKALKLL